MKDKGSMDSWLRVSLETQGKNVNKENCWYLCIRFKIYKTFLWLVSVKVMSNEWANEFPDKIFLHSSMSMKVLSE
jgi:hypothetical protein